MNPKDLLGVKANPPGFDSIRSISRAAKAYHALNPYPDYSAMTKDWKTEERGPYPRCLPFVRHIVTKGARWLFGKPLSFRVGDDEAASELVNDCWTDNDMTRRSNAMGVTGALSGGVALKWSWDEEDGGAKIQILDPAEHTRFYWDPFDQSKLLMARVQFPYFDAVQNLWFWYREDWTDETEQVYKPLPMSFLTDTTAPDPYALAPKADLADKWEIQSVKANPFQVIPLWYCRNVETGRESGEGDLWSVYHVIDLVNFSYDLAHKNNQKSIDPKEAYIDLQAPAEDATGMDGPMGTRTLETRDGAEGQGKIQILQPDTSLRPHLKEFATDLLKMIRDVAGSVDIDAAEVTNKGNLTTAVLTQLYAPLIDATEAKRVSYGEDGICVFFERMSEGLSLIPGSEWKPFEDVQIQWPSFWEAPEEEKTALVTRQQLMVENAFTTHERATRHVAKADGVIDVDDLLKETAKAKAEKDKKEADLHKAEMGDFAKAKRGMTP